MIAFFLCWAAVVGGLALLLIMCVVALVDITTAADEESHRVGS